GRLTPPRPPNTSRPKTPAATPPHRPHRPCSGHTPRTSSIFSRYWQISKPLTKMRPAAAPTTKLPAGCITSEPAQTATSPARAPWWTKPGPARPTTSAARMPPTIAISEFIATRPDTAASEPADMTLKPNQPTQSSHEPRASQGMLDGGNPALALPGV